MLCTKTKTLPRITLIALIYTDQKSAIRTEEARPEKIKLPSLGDENAIQAAIAKGAQAVVDGKLDQKQAKILGYYLQLALSNVKRVDFEEGWGADEAGDAHCG